MTETRITVTNWGISNIEELSTFDEIVSKKDPIALLSLNEETTMNPSSAETDSSELSGCNVCISTLSLPISKKYYSNQLIIYPQLNIECQNDRLTSNCNKNEKKPRMTTYIYQQTTPEISSSHRYVSVLETPKVCVKHSVEMLFVDEFQSNTVEQNKFQKKHNYEKRASINYSLQSEETQPLQYSVVEYENKKNMIKNQNGEISDQVKEGYDACNIHGKQRELHKEKTQIILEDLVKEVELKNIECKLMEENRTQNQAVLEELPTAAIEMQSLISSKKTTISANHEVMTKILIASEEMEETMRCKQKQREKCKPILSDIKKAAQDLDSKKTYIENVKLHKNELLRDLPNFVESELKAKKNSKERINQVLDQLPQKADPAMRNSQIQSRLQGLPLANIQGKSLADLLCKSHPNQTCMWTKSAHSGGFSWRMG